ncbi:MAG: hypothetical protein WBL65_25475, partial [Bryobacteraceae bacterium]
AGQVAARAGAGADRADTSGGVVTLPSAAGRSEAIPGVVVTLPAPPPPIATPAPEPPKVAAAALPPIPPPSDDHPPVLRRAARVYPVGFDSDSALFCQAMIGVWTEAEARALLGEPSRQRLAIGEDQSESGLILAFADPTGHYQELELDFANETGVLRGVFAYPWKMTWQECRGLWGADVLARKANQGRTFYSYLNRRLDVLVDGTGKVISLGLY